MRITLGTLLIICFTSANASAQQIYLTDQIARNIQRADVGIFESQVDLVALPGMFSFGIALDMVGGKMYWTALPPVFDGAESEPEGKIQRANLDGTDVEDLIPTGLGFPRGIALDLVRGKMYWADEFADTIQRANLDGSDIEVVISITPSPVGGPKRIVLDVIAGKMYWTQSSPTTIQRANLDGSDVEILRGGFPSAFDGLALDLPEGKIYWTDRDSQSISRANLDGSDREVVRPNVDDFLNDLALDPENGKVYWTRLINEFPPHESRIMYANMDGSGLDQTAVALLTWPRGIALPVIRDCNANSVPDEEDVLFGTSFDCNGNSTPDECDLAAGRSSDCNVNSVLDECELASGTSRDCNANAVPDECDLSSGTSEDLNVNEVLDDCECPPSVPTIETVPVATNRFLTVVPGSPHQVTALRVTFVDLPAPLDIWNGSQMWVGKESEVSESGSAITPTAEFPSFLAAPLQCTPHYAAWGALGAVHVFHEGIVPGGDYVIQAIDDVCDLGVAAEFSEPLSMTTAIWGDTVLDLSQTPPLAPEGIVNIVDALAVLERFSSAPGSISKVRADLFPGCLDLIIHVSDVLASLAGFSGLSYPFTATADDPCDSTCPNLLP